MRVLSGDKKLVSRRIGGVRCPIEIAIKQILVIALFNEMDVGESVEIKITGYY